METLFQVKHTIFMASICPKVLNIKFYAFTVSFFSFPFDCLYSQYWTHILNNLHGISDAPIYIYIHGGYWQILDICKEVSAYGVAPLVATGIKVIVMNYEKCPNVSLEQLVDEMERAIDFILDFALEQKTR